MRALGKVLAALPLELTPEQADELFNAVLTAMYSTAEAETVRDLSPVFAEFLAELGPKQARRMTSPLLAAFQDLAHTLYVEDTDIFRSIRQELAARPFELTNEQAREAIATILDGINDALVGQDVLQALGQLFAALAEGLSPEQAREAVAPILAAIQETTDPDPLGALTLGLAALPIELTPEHARQASRRSSLPTTSVDPLATQKSLSL
jgi:hypothetical protein